MREDTRKGRPFVSNFILSCRGVRTPDVINIRRIIDDLEKAGKTVHEICQHLQEVYKDLIIYHYEKHQKMVFRVL